MLKSSNAPVRCGIVLAAGDGQRVKSFIHRVWGEHMPKQYVQFLGSRSLLEQTFHRSEKLILPDHLFTVVSQKHLQHPEVGRQLSGRPKGTVVIQPSNKDTAPGLLLPLMHLYKRYPEAVVVILPSDHFVIEEDLFMGYVELACRMVERNLSRLLLLGIDPYGPEPEYGYIVPGERNNHGALASIRNVLGFIEKPPLDLAHKLLQGGSLWNTMVMVSKAKTLLELAKKTQPALYQTFQEVLEVIGSPQEMNVLEAVYQNLQPLNFSSGLLEALPSQFPSCLDVLPVKEVFWSDWGSEQRIVSDLRKTGHLGSIESYSKETALKYDMRSNVSA